MWGMLLRDVPSEIVSYPSTKLVKGQLQRFHKLISNDRIWPQNTVSKLFLKNLCLFLRYRRSKSGTSAGSILGFIRFPKIIIGKPLSVT